MSDLGDVTTNDLVADLADGITGNVNPGLIARDHQYHHRLWNCICNGQYWKTGISRSLAMVDVTLPLACFADASRASREVPVGITWWVNNESVRRLPGLQNNDDLPDTGSFEYTLDIEIVPMEDGSSASITKSYYCASAASAGMAAALLL
ncbi:hypothetical protein IV203_019998 [Nitzschia inconspicua]|uniref:Uncharacterized protein n=1 Tax=Nitzschia inconspicua TaxID=303405 RepID=A0A9K3Q529_9STRA|nr:hypothetical protein IV203_019998 [Nitzschia inconspicua]